MTISAKDDPDVDQVFVERASSEWLTQTCCGSRNKAELLAIEAKTLIEAVISHNAWSLSAEPSSSLSPEVASLTWRSVFNAACFIKNNKEKMEAETREALAFSFLGNNGDSSSFLAASIMSNEGSDEKEKEGALAYMIVFPDQMQEWYSYNETSKDPLVVVSKSCKCLPRKKKSCSTCATGRPPNPNSSGRSASSTSAFSTGDRVRIRDVEREEMERLQEGFGGFVENMTRMGGLAGIVESSNPRTASVRILEEASPGEHFTSYAWNIEMLEHFS